VAGPFGSSAAVTRAGGAWLDLDTVAEGVEHSEQAEAPGG
jgi:hypothetical protein